MINLDKEMKDFIDLMGACERIRNTPIPYSYSMFIKKFLFLYLVTLPLGFVSTFGYFTIPTVLLVLLLFCLVLSSSAKRSKTPSVKISNDLLTG